MNRRLELFSIVLFAASAGVVGAGVTSAIADEEGIEARVGELRGTIMSLFAPAGAVATETNPNYKGAAAPAPAAAPPPAPKPAPPPPKIFDFVSEADVRAAMTRNEKIFIGPKTIVTPAARDLASVHDTLVMHHK